jgi:hypothetical protein
MIGSVVYMHPRQNSDTSVPHDHSIQILSGRSRSPRLRHLLLRNIDPHSFISHLRRSPFMSAYQYVKSVIISHAPKIQVLLTPSVHPQPSYSCSPLHPQDQSSFSFAPHNHSARSHCSTQFCTCCCCGTGRQGRRLRWCMRCKNPRNSTRLRSSG